MPLVGFQKVNKSTDQSGNHQFNPRYIPYNIPISDHSKHYPTQLTCLYQASGNMPQSKGSTECSQNPYCLQPTPLPTSVSLQIRQTLMSLYQTHPKGFHIRACPTASESRQGQMKSVALTSITFENCLQRGNFYSKIDF